MAMQEALSSNILRMHNAEKDKKILEHASIMHDISSMKYEALCELAFSLDVKDMSLRRDYSSYINIMVAKEFIGCIFLLDIKHLVGISTDGDNSMLGCHQELVSKLNRDVPNLIVVHCVAHREALVIVDACKGFPCLSYVEKIANKVYSWINASNVRHSDFQKLLQEMNLQVLVVLKIHDVRWLARGNVTVHLVKLLPAILTFWKSQAPMWYEKLCIFKVLFCIHLLADVLLELDGLTKIFQKESTDISSFSTSIEVCLNSLKKKFLGDIFAKSTNASSLKYVNENGEEYTHTLLYVSMPGKDKNGFPLDIQDGSLNTCIEMAKDFVLKVIDCVNERFPAMYFFNASKLFSPMYHPNEEDERDRKSIIWLSRLLTRIGNHVINANGCEKGLKAFVDTLYYGCQGMNFKDAWRFFSNTSHCQETFPNLLRGFSKQNIIKIDRRQHLKVDTLDMLMQISMLGPSCDLIDWERIYDIWEKSKDQRMADL
ncbi:hypothetical protein KP509_11G098700 [Ceratopteris richardii]|uniref:DUF4371 domain-containing protein n=1 Tax=Ceratopteris richardii TaxID=49495 RepID=A0A8T2TYC9_CERRI|nr:hypothetical protein KP509_11G098700 [Ceratopteris richardii]